MYILYNVGASRKIVNKNRFFDRHRTTERTPFTSSFTLYTWHAHSRAHTRPLINVALQHDITFNLQPLRGQWRWDVYDDEHARTWIIGSAYIILRAESCVKYDTCIFNPRVYAHSLYSILYMYMHVNSFTFSPYKKSKYGGRGQKVYNNIVPPAPASHWPRRTCSSKQISVIGSMRDEFFITFGFFFFSYLLLL